MTLSLRFSSLVPNPASPKSAADTKKEDDDRFIVVEVSMEIPVNYRNL